jgi:hypothetical protein
MAEVGKGAGAATGTAAGVEDVGLIWKFRQEAAIEAGHVDFDGIVDERIRVPLMLWAGYLAVRKVTCGQARA